MGGGNAPGAQSTRVTLAKQVEQKAPRRQVVTTPDDDPALSSGFLTKKSSPAPTFSFGIAEAAAPTKPKPTTPQPAQSTTTTVGMGLTTTADPRTQPGPVSMTQQIRNIEKAKKIAEKKKIQDQKAANVGEQPAAPKKPTTRPARVKVKPLNQYWTPNRPPMPPSKPTPSRRPIEKHNWEMGPLGSAENPAPPADSDPQQEPRELNILEKKFIRRAFIAALTPMARLGNPLFMMESQKNFLLGPLDDPA